MIRTIPLSEPPYLPYQYIPNEPKKVLTREQIKYIEDNILAPYVFKLNKTVMSGSMPSFDKNEIRKMIQEVLPGMIPHGITKEDVSLQCKEINNELKHSYDELKRQFEDLKTQTEMMKPQIKNLNDLNIDTRLKTLEKQYTELNTMLSSHKDIPPGILTQFDELNRLINGKANITDIDSKLKQFKDDFIKNEFDEFKKDIVARVDNINKIINKFRPDHKNEEESRQLKDLTQQISSINKHINTLHSSNLADETHNIQELNKLKESIEQLTAQITQKNTGHLNTDILTPQLQAMNDRIEELKSNIKGIIETIVTEKLQIVNEDIDQIKQSNADITNSLDKLKTEHTQLHDSNAVLSGRITVTENDIQTLKRDIDNIDTKIAKLDEEYVELIGYRDKIKDDFDNAIKQIQKFVQEDTKIQLDKLKDNFKEQILQGNLDLKTKLEKQEEIIQAHTLTLKKFNEFEAEYKNLAGAFETLATKAEMKSIQNQLKEFIRTIPKDYVDNQKLDINNKKIVQKIASVVEAINNMLHNLANSNDIDGLKKHLIEQAAYIGKLQERISKQ